MYGYTKRFAKICGIFTACTIAATAMLFLFLSNAGISFSLIFNIGLFVVAVSGFNLFMTLGIHRLCEVVEMDYEDNVKRFHDLNKKIAELEEKCK